MENDEQFVSGQIPSRSEIDAALRGEAELDLEDPESRLTDSDWVEKEPTQLEKINWFKKHRPKHKWKNQLEELRALLQALSERLDRIEQHLPDLDLDRGVITWNTRWGNVVFNAADLASVGGATQAWVMSILPTVGDIDGGTY